MSPVEKAYAEYLKNTDNVLEIDGNLYHRIVWKECFNLTGIGPILSIILPNELFKGQASKNIVDENGRTFELTGPEQMRFSSGIPEWYLNCWSFIIKGIVSTDQIGDYVKIIV